MDVRNIFMENYVGLIIFPWLIYNNLINWRVNVILTFNLNTNYYDTVFTVYYSRCIHEKKSRTDFLKMY